MFISPKRYGKSNTTIITQVIFPLIYLFPFKSRIYWDNVGLAFLAYNIYLENKRFIKKLSVHKLIYSRTEMLLLTITSKLVSLIAVYELHYKGILNYIKNVLAWNGDEVDKGYWNVSPRFWLLSF